MGGFSPRGLYAFTQSLGILDAARWRISCPAVFVPNLLSCGVRPQSLVQRYSSPISCPAVFVPNLLFCGICPQSLGAPAEALSRDFGNGDGMNRKDARLLQGHSACVQGGPCGKYIIDHQNAFVCHL